MAFLFQWGRNKLCGQEEEKKNSEKKFNELDKKNELGISILFDLNNRIVKYFAI